MITLAACSQDWGASFRWFPVDATFDFAPLSSPLLPGRETSWQSFFNFFPSKRRKSVTAFCVPLAAGQRLRRRDSGQFQPKLHFWTGKLCLFVSRFVS